MRTLSACQTVLMGWWVRSAEHLASLHVVTMDEAGKQVDWWPVPMELLLGPGLLCLPREAPSVCVCGAAPGFCQSLVMWLSWAGLCGGRCHVLRRPHRNLWLFSGRAPIRTQHPVSSPSPPSPPTPCGSGERRTDSRFSVILRTADREEECALNVL